MFDWYQILVRNMKDWLVFPYWMPSSNLREMWSHCTLKCYMLFKNLALFGVENVFILIPVNIFIFVFDFPSCLFLYAYHLELPSPLHPITKHSLYNRLNFVHLFHCMYIMCTYCKFLLSYIWFLLRILLMLLIHYPLWSLSYE